METPSYPKMILAACNNSSGEVEVLICWNDLPTCEDSRELFSVIQLQYPDFHLEEKVNLLGGVMLDHQLQVYTVEG